ncbi:MAG: hypothetical protein QM664_10285 [Flavihumibacter sp.]
MYTGAAAQDFTAIADSLKAEGMRIYQSEITSWHASDIFIDKYKTPGNIGGYFSYKEGDAFICTFINKGDHPRVIGTVQLDSSFNPQKTQTTLTEREMTAKESEYYLLRTAAYATLQKGGPFERYDNTRLNIVPLINGNDKKVYVLTGPTSNGMIIFGNDYLLQFNAANEWLSTKKIHTTLLPVEFDPTGINDPQAGIHSHQPATGEYITATDIATLLLYQKFARWDNYIVVAQNHVSVWNCVNNSLFITTREAWEKTYRQQKKKRRR